VRAARGYTGIRIYVPIIVGLALARSDDPRGAVPPVRLRRERVAGRRRLGKKREVRADELGILAQPRAEILGSVAYEVHTSGICGLSVPLPRHHPPPT